MSSIVVTNSSGIQILVVLCLSVVYSGTVKKDPVEKEIDAEKSKRHVPHQEPCPTDHQNSQIWKPEIKQAKIYVKPMSTGWQPKTSGWDQQKWQPPSFGWQSKSSGWDQQKWQTASSEWQPTLSGWYQRKWQPMLSGWKQPKWQPKSSGWEQQKWQPPSSGWQSQSSNWQQSKVNLHKPMFEYAPMYHQPMILKPLTFNMKTPCPDPCKSSHGTVHYAPLPAMHHIKIPQINYIKPHIQPPLHFPPIENKAWKEPCD